MNTLEVYLEVGPKKTIAGPLDWPGWCRGGPGEAAALQALVDYLPRYARVLHSAGLDFQPPTGVPSLVVVERLAGNATTDYGVPGLIPEADRRSFDLAECERQSTLLQACWLALDSVAQTAAGKELRKGPRGGGRELDEILRHVLEADKSYLSRLGWKAKPAAAPDLAEEFRQVRQDILDGLSAATRGELPLQGPRGGVIWPPRYFVRRTAWHVLDHAWEIEDRAV
jgi:hypothetical protein